MWPLVRPRTMDEPARLVLVRHGETVGNSSIRYHGRTDVALSDLGRRQIRAARDLLKSDRSIGSLGAVFTSPLSRAQESARIIVGEEIAPTVIDEFSEVDFGLFEGLTAEEIRTRYPVEFRQWNKDRLAADFTYPEGESRAAFVQRVARGSGKMLARWNEIRANGGAATALLVAHRGVIRALIRELAGIDTPRIEIASIHVLEHEPCGANLRAGRWHPVVLDLNAHLINL
jgi:broad specificity phosphatase PhoE